VTSSDFGKNFRVIPITKTMIARSLIIIIFEQLTSAFILYYQLNIVILSIKYLVLMTRFLLYNQNSMLISLLFLLSFCEYNEFLLVTVTQMWQLIILRWCQFSLMCEKTISKLRKMKKMNSRYETLSSEILPSLFEQWFPFFLSV